MSDDQKTHKNPNLRRTSQDNDGACIDSYCDEHFTQLCTLSIKVSHLIKHFIVALSMILNVFKILSKNSQWKPIAENIFFMGDIILKQNRKNL